MASESPSVHEDRGETGVEKRDPLRIFEDMRKDPRRKIIQEIKKIQPQAGKHFKDLKIPDVLLQEAGNVARKEEAGRRFKKVPVYELLVEHIRHKGGADCETLTKSQPVLEGWKTASIALFRYALNLQLAPKRPEFKKMKLSTSFYVYNISRYLYQAERVLHVMGYKSTDKKEKKEGQDLVYEGEVKLVTVLETATDLLVMHEEICLLQQMVQYLINENRDAGVRLEVLVRIRQNSKSYEEALATVMGLQASDGSENPTYANLQGLGPERTTEAVMHEGIHAYNPSHEGSQVYVNASCVLSSTDSPQMHGHPGNMVTPQQSTHSQYYDNLPGSTQYSSHEVAGNQTVPRTQGTTPQQYGPPNSQMVGQYQSNFAPPHTTSQEYYHQPPPNVSQSYATTDVPQSSHSQVAVSQYQPGPRPAVSQHQPGPRPAVSQHQPGPRPAVSHHQPGPRPAVSHHQPGPAGRGWDDTQYPQTENVANHIENVDPAELNVLRQRMESHNMPPSNSQDDRQSLNETNESINPDNLPPPMMDFSCEVQESGLMSGIVDARSGGDGISPLPSSESGPKALQINESDDHLQNVTHNHSFSKSPSNESDDLYGSGPKPPYTYQRSSSSSVHVPPALKETAEGSWVVIGEGGQDDVPSTPKSPALVTQGSQDAEPRALNSEAKPVPKPRKIRDKTQSVDIVEDKKRGEKGHSVMRSCKSGSNLLDSVHIDQSTSNTLQDDLKGRRNLPVPRPRSRSPSPGASSNENSPSTSPTPPHRYLQQPPNKPPAERSTHEMWPPSAPPKQLKASTLPRQVQSFDTESGGKREMSHFSSGSNIRVGEHFYLPFKPSTAQNTIEPDTPVKGINPDAWMKMKKATNSDRVSSSKLTSHGLGKDRTPPISQSPVSSPTKPLSAQPTVNDPLSEMQPQNDGLPLNPTPDVLSSQSSAPYSPPEEPPSPHPVSDPTSSPVKDTSHSRLSVFPASTTKSSPVVGTTTAKADSAITTKPDESRLDYGGESAHALRKTIEQDQGRNSEEQPTMRGRANAHSGQRPDKKELEIAMKDGIAEFDDSTTELETKFGISLTEHWVCQYCTNLVQESEIRCDVCHNHRYESLV